MSVIRRWLWTLVLAFGLGLGGVAAARAQGCDFSASGLDFGTVDTLGTGASDISGTLTVNCSTLLGLGLLSSVYGTISIGEGQGGADSSTRFMTSGTTATALSYQLYHDAARSQIIGSDYGSYGGDPIDIADFNLLLLGTGTVTVPIYGRVFGGQSALEPGSYSSLFNRDIIDVRVDYVTCNVLLICIPRTETFSFEVTATVADECLVTAQDLDFGAVGVLSANIDAATTLEVICTAGTSFTIDLDDGLYGGSPGARAMRSPAGDDVTYGLYSDAARGQLWGDDLSGLAVAGTGAGSAETFDVYGRVPPQSTPPPGVYSDTIVVTVTY